MPRARHGAVFESFGLAVEVVTDDPELLPLLPSALPEWRSGNGIPPSACFRVKGDGTITLDGAELGHSPTGHVTTLAVLSTELRRHLAVHAPDHVFIHAGVVGVDATAIVIPGASFSGKTTLVTELLRAGANYYSDEYAAVDAEGLIHAYPRKLSLRGDPGWGNRHIPVPVAEARIGTKPIRAGLIVVTRYESGVPWRPVECTRAEGAMALFEHTVPAQSRPGSALAAARRLAENARVLIGPRGEASIVAAELVSHYVDTKPT